MPQHSPRFLLNGAHVEIAALSEAAGGPPLTWALSAFHALRDAIAGVAHLRYASRVDAPATGERIPAAIAAVRSHA